MKELKMFIDGRFIEHESGKWIKVLNPSTEEVISLMLRVNGKGHLL